MNIYTPEYFFSRLFEKAPSDWKMLMVEKTAEGLTDGFRAPPDSKGAIYAKLHKAGSNRCLFFHCGIDEEQTRRRRLRKEDVSGNTFLWVDIDRELSQGEIDKFKTEELAPSFIVSTGRGLHMYWILDEYVTDHAAIENRNRWLVKKYSADHCIDVTRILRVPGSFNTKQLDNIRPVEIVFSNADKVYGLGDFGVEEGTHRQVDTGTVDAVEFSLEDDRLSPWLRTMITDASAANGDRSNRDWKLANKLAESGFSAGEILGALTHPTWACGEKGRENRRYAERTAVSAYKDSAGIASMVRMLKNADLGKKKLQPVKEIRDRIHEIHRDVLQVGGTYRPDKNAPKLGGVFGHKVAEVIEQSGYKFVFDPEYNQAFIADRQGRVWEAGDGGKDLSKFISKLSGFSTSQQEFGFISLGIQNYIEENGERIKLGRWVHYDQVKECFYILADDSTGLIYCIDKEGNVSEDKNGVNDIFLRPRVQAFRPLDIDFNYLGKPGMKLVEDRFVDFVAGDDKAQRFLQCFMIALTLCYGAEIRTLPILHLTGPSGGGKSSTLGCMTCFLFGFYQVLIYTTAGAFRVVPNETFMAHDDKESIDHMEEFLLLCATSASRTMADVRNSDSVVIQKAHVVNAITSIGQLESTAMRRRALVLEIDAEKFPSKKNLTEDEVRAIVEDRDKMWAGVIPIMGAVAKHYSDGTFREISRKVYNRIQISTFRGLADFVALMVLVHREIDRIMGRPHDEDQVIKDFIGVADLNNAGEILGRDPLALCLDTFFERVHATNSQEVYHMDDVSGAELKSIAVNRGIKSFQWEFTSEEENQEVENLLGCKVRGIKASSTGWVSIFSSDSRDFAKTLKSPPSLGRQFSRVESKTDFPFYITKGRDRKLGRIWNAFQKIE